MAQPRSAEPFTICEKCEPRAHTANCQKAVAAANAIVQMSQSRPQEELDAAEALLALSRAPVVFDPAPSAAAPAPNASAADAPQTQTQFALGYQPSYRIGFQHRYTAHPDPRALHYPSQPYVRSERHYMRQVEAQAQAEAARSARSGASTRALREGLLYPNDKHTAARSRAVTDAADAHRQALADAVEALRQKQADEEYERANATEVQESSDSEDDARGDARDTVGDAAGDASKSVAGDIVEHFAQDKAGTKAGDDLKDDSEDNSHDECRAKHEKPTLSKPLSARDKKRRLA